MTDAKVLQNAALRDDGSNTTDIWTGTRQTNYSKLTDEYGNEYTVNEFLQKIGIDKSAFLHGNYFPESVEMTGSLTFTTTTTYGNSCYCLCKTIDISLWQG